MPQEEVESNVVALGGGVSCVSLRLVGTKEDAGNLCSASAARISSRDTTEQ